MRDLNENIFLEHRHILKIESVRNTIFKSVACKECKIKFEMEIA